ncbi:putative oxidoreductase YjmC [Roseovarius litorisediminis]|uniref:Putative oxidoreductase YjmC n=1 Tax=Roseovarius litorisediminis TaxID=1312363 RepID=A0A1Y5RTQ9_9RHOB|nr:Ldh family oxidoreductase [Roseovarius litorisediminis]SLN25280.1 putative oxidoreductase YjmC [Roseovarius litorisediminis]
MTVQAQSGSKLKANDRVAVPADRIVDLATRMFVASGCDGDVAHTVACHLAEADHCGVESHGLVRVLQYTREFRDGALDPSARPVIHSEAPNRLKIDAGGGIGIPAMALALREAAKAARAEGLAVASVIGAGHTGRLGAFAEEAAREGCMTITLGGGNRQTWRMVAPHGGRQALLPTNPYCIGIPGGYRGPVVLDIATSQIAGGWIYAARAAGINLPDGAVVDRDGMPTRKPADYFNGGAILPKGGPLGSGLALIAELVGEAMLGPVEKGEINWLVLALDCGQFRGPGTMQRAAEEILTEIRDCPPAQGVDRVMVPGERERDQMAGGDRTHLRLPEPIWQQILDMARDMGLEEKMT